MTEARLQLDPGSGKVTLRLQIDLLRTLGSPEAYREFAQDLNNPVHEAYWLKLASAIEICQAESRLLLTVLDAAPPEPFDAAAFDDPFQWPRIWVTLDASGYQPEQPVTVKFTTDFVFEEPIAITISDGDARMSRWLVTEQISPPFVATETALAAGRVTENAEPPFADQMQPFSGALWSGFNHIIPGGVDHLLFVLAVLLTCASVRQAALAVTAFTIGHSVSLAIAGFRLLTVPAVIVEPLILLSITLYAMRAAWVARSPGHSASNFFWPVVAIGLLHGLGFAAAFAELQWAQSPIVHLLGFNLGIELAQLLFVLLAYSIVSRLSRRAILWTAVALALTPLLLLAGWGL